MRPAISSHYRQPGFTLIELMVTLAVFTVLALIAVPSFVDYLARSRLRGAADNIVSQLAIARAEAMRLHRNVIVNFQTGSGTWCSGGHQYDLPAGSTEGITLGAADATSCTCKTTPATCLINGNQSLLTSTDYPTVDLLSGGSSAFQFDRNVGVLTTLASTTITLRSRTRPSRYKLNIVVGPLGHARVCVPTGFASFGGYVSCG